ncbi:flocculation protein FLO11-like [Scomber scombrus]|uniref:Flocculation protein FLO11-like n=1 Tax=Scomber scombrus TaxID=13677 RepID=A0AAV1N796_SCOSC
MELPLGGPALRHYTQSRPRPHRQKLNYRPSRPQETIIESENEVLELMGRVDEGVEEFFTKRVLPADTLKKQDDESITVHEVAPASSAPCPPPTKTLRRKLGDFFTLKKRRGLKSETSHEGRPKKASIADLIRPLREVARAEKEKDKERVKEHDKENEKEKAKEHPSAVTGESAVQETPVSGAPPLRGEAVPPRRALREGKSQSLILLSGSAAAATGTTNGRNTAKKQFEGQHSFEQKLHLMLQRIGVSKAQPGETQNQEGEMKKAESEGTIIDSKAELPPTFTKPRTMSASSDTRHQIRPSVSAHESAGKPALLPKPVIKPGPPPTTSGRNTPENELAQIQEGETNTPTKLSQTAAPSAPSATTTPTVPTISDSVPDSTNVTISPSSTVTPSDLDICIDSVNATAEATTPTNVTEFDSKASIPEASATTTEIPTSTFPTSLTSTTTPTEPPAPVSVTSTPSESITPSLYVTSKSTTITSITTSETISAPSSESLVPTTSTNLSTKLTLPEPNDILTFGSDAVISVITAVGTTSTSDTPSDVSTSSVTVASDDFSVSATSTSPVTLNTPITSSPTLVCTAPPTTSTTTTSPTFTDCMNSISTSTIPDVSAPSSSSSETNPTDTITTTNASLTTAAAVSSPLTTDSDPPDPNNASPTLTLTISSLLATDNSSATSHHLTSAASSNDNKDNDLQTHLKERSSLEPVVKDTEADEELEVVQKSKQAEKNESKTVVDGGKENEHYKEKPAEVNSEVTKKEAQEESVKPEEVTVTTEVGTAQPPSGKEGVPFSNEEVIKGQNQEETKAADEK